MKAQAMRKAWEIFKKAGVRTMKAWSDALRKAWAIVKGLAKEEKSVKQLKGTPKQVSWAETIRNKVIENKENIRPYLEEMSKRDEMPHMVDRIMNALDKFIETEERATAWIDVFKPITSQYSNKPAHTHILGGIAQEYEKFGLDLDDSLFVYKIGRYLLK